MAALQSVRGTHDLTGDAARRYRHVVETARHVAHRFGHSDIEIPIFEFTPVFARTMGEGSDVVRKEMYTFADRGGEELTLRPEATAGIARAFISGGLQQHLPLKFFTAGPMFRYERPQKGRQRQFHQIDVEILGVAGPQADIEVIAIGATILKELGVLEKCVLQINSLGDPISRSAYRDALVEFFSGCKDQLSKDSLDRLQRNPLRILDSKDPGDQILIPNAPRFADFLNSESVDFFKSVKIGLDDLAINYEINERLVRGLDYYTHTAFEFVTDALGAQGAVIAGGRYDGLIKTLGGPDTPGIGWAGGVERLVMLIEAAPEPTRPIALIPLGEQGQSKSLKLAQKLREAGENVEHGYSGNLKKRLKRANAVNARVAVMLGEEEIERGAATVRDLDSGEQHEVPFADLLAHLIR